MSAGVSMGRGNLLKRSSVMEPTFLFILTARKSSRHCEFLLFYDVQFPLEKIKSPGFIRYLIWY